MSDTATETPPADDYTVALDEAKPGQVVFEYGYIPVVVFGNADGQLEVGRFASMEYIDPANVSTRRAELPEASKPAQATAADRIGALENQVSALLDVIKSQGLAQPTEVAPAPDAPEPTEVDSPFTQSDEA